MRAGLRALVVVACFAPSTGCVMFDAPVSGGDVFGPDAPLENGEELLANAFGDLVLVGGDGQQTFDVPTVSDHRFFDATFVDLDLVPPIWRPAHARAGGVIVSRLARSSPLARAGIKPFDVIRAIDGAPVRSADELVRQLGSCREGDRLEVDVTRVADAGSAHAVVAVGEPVHESAIFYLPFVAMQIREGPNSVLGIGPFDALFTRWTHWDCDTEDSSSTKLRPEVTLATGWSTLFYAFRYEEKTFLDRGTRRRRLYLFWFIPIPLGEDSEVRRS